MIRTGKYIEEDLHGQCPVKQPRLLFVSFLEESHHNHHSLKIDAIHRTLAFPRSHLHKIHLQPKVNE